MLLTAACSSAGPYSSPYALVESGSRSAVRKELPVLINEVDGVSTLDPRYPGPITPGKHRVRVYFPLSTGAYDKRVRELEIDAQPCTRYRIVAAYENLTHVEWKPVIYPEPIGECLERRPS